LASKFLSVFRTEEVNSRLGITELQENNNKSFQRRTGILTFSANEKIYIVHGDEMKLESKNTF
jgi:hypothetical protein